MAEYLSPGVYVEEIEIGAKPIEGVSTSTAGFLGETERGPTTPKFITSWLQYQRVYGSYFGSDKYLPYAVEGFFKNGGQRCYLARIVKADALPSNFRLTDGSGDNALSVEAIGEGESGNQIAIKVSKGTFGGFKLSVWYWKELPATLFDPEVDLTTMPRPTVEEVYDNLSITENSPDYYEKRINGISNLIKIFQSTVSGDEDNGNRPENPSSITYLTNGTNGTGDIILSDYERIDTGTQEDKKGLTAFEKIDDISILYAPNVYSITGLVGSLISHCENIKDRFVILDCIQGASDSSTLNPRNLNPTQYGAYYYPWIYVIDPATGMKKLVPPGGYMAGIYARSDVERGVHKAPANEKVRGVVELEFPITKGEQDILNPRGVNCIRAFPGRGIRVWGARTLSSDPSWKYINVRRLFLYLEESIDEGTQWVVFEPNNEQLWDRVKQTITGFLTQVWKDGALMGRSVEEAFFVKCDRTTMTQNDIDNGRLIVMIGVAPVKPAEFVIFKIAQWTSSSESA